jgi:heavy metal translocating P-type ATPase
MQTAPKLGSVRIAPLNGGTIGRRVTISRQKRTVFSTEKPAAKRHDFAVSFPEDGTLLFHNGHRFSTWRSDFVREFIVHCFGAAEVRQVEIDTVARNAELVLRPESNRKEVLLKLARIFRGEARPDLTPVFSVDLHRGLPKTQPRLRAFRFGQIISTWELRASQPRRLRLRNALIINKPYMVKLIEQEMMGLLGIENYKFHQRAGSISIDYCPRTIHPQQIVQGLDNAISKAPARPPRTRRDFSLPVASTSLVVSASATFFVPGLLPIGTLLMLCTAVPSYRGAYRVLVKQRRMGVDVLDSTIFTACLFTGQIFAGAMTAWFLSFGRRLLNQTRSDSAKVLLQVFGKQPSLARVLRDGAEIETPLDKIEQGDRVVVYTGEVVPVDGVLVEGDAILDQHALTGESAPAEKTVGDKVFASTVMLAGKIVVQVEQAGKDTASSKISAILNQTVSYKLNSQSRGESMADKAVTPSFGIAAIAGASIDISGALAVINSEMGTGIRMAAPLGMLTSLTACAQNGILVKDGRALEIMRKVDTVLFDKTGTLTREKPEVARIICCEPYNDQTLLTYAAAAEQKFTHPIARAILEKFAETGKPLPPLDDSKYSVGYGITVEINKQTVRVGSRRFMEMEKIPIPAWLDNELRTMHGDGNSFVNVAINGEMAGVIELRSSHRPEVEEILAGLRKRGVKHLAIISGDHKEPTRRLAERLGMDRYFAEVLPQDKARYVEQLQAEGKTVCFVGDGINDSIALKKANVSISLRGASSIATDTAQVVFMEESLAKICTLFDLSNNLETNVQRSWYLILLPNSFCIAGVFLFGFNIWHSVFFNNVSALLSLANGMVPLRHVKSAHNKWEKDVTRTVLATPAPPGAE